MNWLLPEYISDALPQESAGIESRRRAILDLFRTCGYELIIPPLIEYLDSLLTGTGRDLDLRTFKLTDQLSGKTLGLRADITPQAARIDAHLLNREGVVRLCYCDSTLHTLPTVTGNREPLQIGAEIYGYPGLEADRETIRLMAQSLETAGLPAERIDISHVGIFRALARSAALSPTAENELLGLLQSKDSAGLKTFTATLSEPLRTVFQAMPALYGGVEILAQAARVLPDTPEIRQALADLRCLAETLADLPLSFDLADLRGYHYHNGVVFAAYSGEAAGAIALGGRYDGAGQAFGRARPATGFSFDLREVVRLSPLLPAASGITAPYAGTDAQLAACIRMLRQRGEIVVESLPGDIPVSGPPCDRQLVYKNGQWEIEALPAQIV